MTVGGWLDLGTRRRMRAVFAAIAVTALMGALTAAARADVQQRIPVADTNLRAYGLATDWEGDLFAAGITSAGGVVEELAPASAGYAPQRVLPFGTLNSPRGVAVDGLGDVFVVDTQPTPQVLELPAGATAPIVLPFGTLNGAEQIATDESGDLFVADDGDDKVLELPKGSSTPQELPITGLQGADGIAAVGSEIYVSDENADDLVQFEPGSGTQSTVTLPAGVVPGALSANEMNSTLAIVDKAHHDVVESSFGSFSTIPFTGYSGSYGTAVSPDGSGVYLSNGGSFIFGSPKLGNIAEYVTSPNPSPTLTTPDFDDAFKDVDVPVAVNDRNNITIPVTFEPDDGTPEDFDGFGVTSSNPAVISPDGVSIQEVGISNQYRITFEPTSVGEAFVDINAAEAPGLIATLSFDVEAGPEAPDQTTRYLLGAANASSVLEVGGGYILDADDDTSPIRLYDGTTTGYPVASWDFSDDFGAPADKYDFEALARRGDDVYAADSFAEGIGNSPLVDYGIRGSGASTSLSYKGVYYGLEQDLIDWDNANGAPLGLQAAAHAEQKDPSGAGLALEGLEFAPDGNTAYLALRVPLEPPSGTGARTEALIVPVTNFSQLFGGDPAVHAQFGAPILMHLDGLGIREIRKNADNQYLILTGPPAEAEEGTAPPQALWEWDGVAADPPVKLATDIMTKEPFLGGNSAWEGIESVPDPLVQGSQVTLVQDDGKAAPFGQSQKRTVPNSQRAATDAFTIDLGEAENTSAPTVSGTPIVGEALTCAPGAWTTSPTLAEQWLRDGTPIGGATGTTYVPVGADAGHQIACRVIATNAAGSVSASSAAVEPLPAGSVGATGPAGKDGNEGPQGPAGSQGGDGPAGTQGAPGSQGQTGPQGPTGLQGAVGPRGPKGDRGVSASVTCHLTQAKGQRHVTCSVDYPGKGAAGSSSRPLRLLGQGEVVASGHGARLYASRRPAKGTYTLVDGSGSGARRFTVVVG